jgi:hypothetical protein
MRTRSVVLIVVAAALALLAFSGGTFAVAAVRTYQRVLAPAASRMGIECRFTPSCSRFAEIVIERDGLIAGGARAVARVARCGPWTAMGTIDEP